MPDSTRPKSSMFFQVVKGFMTNDGSLKRIIAHPGGKNFSIIFAYITSKSFDTIMLKPNFKGKTGKDIFGNDWISVDEFLERMEWPVTKSNSDTILTLFQSYTQDKALESRRKNEKWEFKYKIDLDYPDDDQLNEARISNKFIMDVIDDLNDFMHPSLEAGAPSHDRTQSLYSPLWEAMLSDPLVLAFQDEMVYQAIEHLPKEQSSEFKILQFGTGAGATTIAIIEHVLENMSDCAIQIFAIEEIPALTSKARDLVSHKLAEIKGKMNEKNLKISFEVETQMFSVFKLNKKNFNLVMGLQILINITGRELIAFFDRLSNYIAEDGIMILGQSTSYSKEFPYPMSIMYQPIVGFKQFPTKDEIKSAVKDFFGSVKSSGLDAIWVMKEPKKY